MSQSLTMQRCSAEENKALKDELTAEQCARLMVLEKRCKRAEKLLGKVPKEKLLVPLFCAQTPKSFEDILSRQTSYKKSIAKVKK